MPDMDMIKISTLMKSLTFVISGAFFSKMDKQNECNTILDIQGVQKIKMALFWYKN